MPNSSEPAGCVERLRPRDTSRETPWVLALAVAVLAAAAGALPFYARTDAVTERVPPVIANAATQLSSAREEVMLMQELDLLGENPTAAELAEAAVPPFDRLAFQQLGPGCLLLDAEPYLLRLLNQVERGWQLDWLDERIAGHRDHAEQGSVAELCGPGAGWHRIDNNPDPQQR